MSCTCAATGPLCPVCQDQRYSQLVGVAKVRGEPWGRHLRTRLKPPWEGSPAFAAAKVADLSTDAGVRERLAVACEAAAREAYERKPGRVGAVAFRVGAPRRQP